jgi:hypothetical protein
MYNIMESEHDIRRRSRSREPALITVFLVSLPDEEVDSRTFEALFTIVQDNRYDLR